MKRTTLGLMPLIASVWLGTPHLVLAQGIPEPGLVIYGIVSNLPPPVVTTAMLVWINRHGAEQVITPARWIIVNNAVFYMVHIPFEMRFTGSPQSLSASPDTFELPSSPAAFTRAAGVNGQPLHFAVSTRSDYAFGPSERGRCDRVDLIAGGAGEDFEQWIARFPSIPNNLRGPDDDPDGDGVRNRDEFIAGTDPGNRSSVLKLDSTLKPEVSPDGFAGIIIEWSSVPGKSYTIERTTNLQNGFVPVALSTQATDVQTSFRDSDARGAEPFFYRIRVE